MKILHLTIKKKWFDLIASGDKVVEYREAKPYWKNRLLYNWDVPGVVTTLKKFQEVHFRNGYRSYSPFMRVEFEEIEIVLIGQETHMPDNGEILKGVQFAIYLGEILEVRR